MTRRNQAAANRADEPEHSAFIAGKAYVGALAIIVLAATAVRIWAAQDELWMDEIWTLLSLGRNVHSPWGILTAHHDNNHYLITFWMYFVAPQRNWFIYRLPSVVAGTGTVILAPLVVRRWGAVAQFAATLLTGSSFVLIYYASEARGYALAGCFALIAFLAMERFLAKRSWGACVTFAFATALGTLSHLTFVQFYIGAVAWSAVGCIKRATSWAQACRWLIALHTAPACLLLALYVIDVRELAFGGGDGYVLREVIANAGALALGVFGQSTVVTHVIALMTVGTVIAALVLLWRESPELWAFFVAGFIAAPIALLALRPPPVLHERYFYLNILFFLLLASFLISRVARWGRSGKCVAVLAILLYITANVQLTVWTLKVGRGNFLDALAYIAENSAGTEIHISGDAIFAYQLYTEFYRAYVPGEHRFVVDPLSPDMPVQPEWIITNSESQNYAPKPAILENSTGRELYRLMRIFPYAGLSGSQFAVYHRIADPDVGGDRD